MYISLYRRYRPQTFSDVVGQTAAIGVITRAIENQAIGHAYLFSGPRGCGKTTIARLFAKAVNCTNRHGPEPCNECETCRSILDGSCLDVIEIDGASNNSVDEIRDLKEHVALASFTCPYKIYIIDEVHMLSISAFNALLKTLEEPPERVVFILATTAPHKVPVTIRSRCQHIPFHGMTSEQIVSRLRQIADWEGMEVQDEALWEIARNSDGGMRDALSLAEQAIAFGTGKISRETVDKLLGGGSSSSIRNWITTCAASPEIALPELDAMFRSGAVPERFLSTLFVCIRNLWLQARWGSGVISRLSLSEEEKCWLDKERNFLPASRLESLMAQISSLLPQVRRGLSNDVMAGLLVSWILSPGGAAPAAAPLSQVPVHMPSPGAPSSYRVQPVREATVRPEPVRPKPDVVPVAPPVPAVQKPEAETASEQLPVTTVNPSPEPLPSPGPAPLTMPVPVAIPDASAMEEKSPNVRGRIDAAYIQHPQIAAALSLADIIYDQVSKTLYVTFDENCAYACRLLDSPKASLAVLSIIGDAAEGAYSIEISAGSMKRSYTTPQAPAGPLPVMEATGAGAVMPSQADLPLDPMSEKEAPVSATVPRKASPAGGLAEFLNAFPESDLLYCKPNEKQEEEETEEEE